MMILSTSKVLINSRIIFKKSKYRFRVVKLLKILDQIFLMYFFIKHVYCYSTTATKWTKSQRVNYFIPYRK